MIAGAYRSPPLFSSRLLPISVAPLHFRHLHCAYFDFSPPFLVSCRLAGSLEASDVLCGARWLPCRLALCIFWRCFLAGSNAYQLVLWKNFLVHLYSPSGSSSVWDDRVCACRALPSSLPGIGTRIGFLLSPRWGHTHYCPPTPCCTTVVILPF